MRKKQIFLLAFALNLMFHYSEAQTYWTGSTTATTSTPGGCRVGGGFIDMTLAGGDASGSWRNLQGGTVNGGLGILANTGAGIGGPSIVLHGYGYPLIPLTSEKRAGSIFFSSYYNTDPIDWYYPRYNTVGHRFLSYDANVSAPSFHTNLEIGNDGRTIVGRDVDYSFIQPGDQLTVRDQIGFYSPTAAGGVINGNAPNGTLSIQENTNSANGPTIGMIGSGYPPLPSGEVRAGSIYYTSYGDNTSGSYGMYGHFFLNFNPSGYSPSMGITHGGRVVIGKDLLWSPTPATAVPPGYLLYVETGILTEKLKVANHTDLNWADFVFNTDYELMPLYKLESYIRTNKRLPSMPSAMEVTQDGIDVAEMDAKLLQKIEELTLYVIQQQKEINELKTKLKQ